MGLQCGAVQFLRCWAILCSDAEMVVVQMVVVVTNNSHILSIALWYAGFEYGSRRSTLFARAFMPTPFTITPPNSPPVHASQQDQEQSWAEVFDQWRRRDERDYFGILSAAFDSISHGTSYQGHAGYNWVGTLWNVYSDREAAHANHLRQTGWSDDRVFADLANRPGISFEGLNNEEFFRLTSRFVVLERMDEIHAQLAALPAEQRAEYQTMFEETRERHLLAARHWQSSSVERLWHNRLTAQNEANATEDVYRGVQTPNEFFAARARAQQAQLPQPSQEAQPSITGGEHVNAASSGQLPPPQIRDAARQVGAILGQLFVR